jgi:hypothetical protein
MFALTMKIDRKIGYRSEIILNHEVFENCRDFEYQKFSIDQKF